MKIKYTYKGSEYVEYIGVDSPDEQLAVLLGSDISAGILGIAVAITSYSSTDVTVNFTGFNSEGRTQDSNDLALDIVNWNFPHIDSDMVEVVPTDAEIVITYLRYETSDGSVISDMTPITIHSCSELRMKNGQVVPSIPNPYPDSLPQPGSGAEGSIPPKVIRNADYAVVYHGGANNTALFYLMTRGLPDPRDVGNNYDSYLIENNYSPNISEYVNAYLAAKDAEYREHFTGPKKYTDGLGNPAGDSHIYAGLAIEIYLRNEETGEYTLLDSNYTTESKVVNYTRPDGSIRSGRDQVIVNGGGSISTASIEEIADTLETRYNEVLEATDDNIAKPTYMPKKVIDYYDIERGSFGIGSWYAVTICTAAIIKGTTPVPSTSDEYNKVPTIVINTGSTMPLMGYSDMIASISRSSYLYEEDTEYVFFRSAGTDPTFGGTQKVDIYLTDVSVEINDDYPKGLKSARKKLN